MTKSVKVSIIIPCFNCEDVVRRAINSVFNQSYKDWELILVDNNSKDNTKNVLIEYQRYFPGQIYVYNEDSPGAPSARNKGLSMARGEWIQFLDADDELMKNKISKQLDFASSGDWDFIVGRFFRVLTLKNRMFLFLKPIKKNPWEGLISGKLGITSSNLWKRSALMEVNGWDESLVSSQEYDLMFRLLSGGKKAGIDRSYPRTKVYFGYESLTRSPDRLKNEQIVRQYFDLRDNIKEYLREAGIYNKRLSKLYSTTLYSFFLDKKSFLGFDAKEFLKDYSVSVSIWDKSRIRMRFLLKNVIQTLRY